MSIKIQKELLASLRRGEQVQKAMHGRAEEMIQLMRIVKSDSLKRSRQFHKMAVACEQGKLKEVKRLHADMQTWRKYKIVL